MYLPGSAGEPPGFIPAVASDPDRRLELVTSAVPGINPLPLDSMPPGIRVKGLFMQPSFGRPQRDGRFRHLPLSYSGFTRFLADGPPFDACILHLAPPGPDGRCSLGAAVEFTPIAAARSARRLGVVNAAMPRIPGAASVVLADLDLVAEVEAPLRTYDVGPTSLEADAIATTLARFVTDGCTIQVGLGKVPDALFGRIQDRRGLRLHSGMLSDGVRGLWDAGALDPGRRPVTCVFVGSPALYAWLDGREGLDVADCSVTHGVGELGRLKRFVAVNSALAVDLLGQCNLETTGGATVSGVGGAPDFARAARHSPGGISIVALPSTFGRDARSRIVPLLSDGLVSLPRHDVDLVVTEHGVADLRAASVHERAEATIAIAAPAHRADLADAWREMASRL